ncbi:MAG: T9SS type A sorting domain-containing protein, partial [Chitinophagaceae bacterium]|nr:T9SS type A sorting domain-containing protein [Chitinophagaceae bacterium]
LYSIQNSTDNNFVKIEGNINSQGQITETGTGFPVLELNGLSNQNINISGTITSNVEVKINNPAGVTLQSALTLPYRLNLINGKITTSLMNMLTLADNAVTAGASSLSFIEGPLRKIGDDSFTFPVGVGTIYSQVTITNVSGGNTSDVFTAEYRRNNPQTVHGPAVEPGMDHVSYVEYWTLTRDAGTAVKRVALAVTPTSFCKSLATTYVSRWNGALWTSEGSTNGGVTLFPPYETGTITSTDDISSFGDFTLITDQPFAINPLPVTLVSFDVIKQNNTALLQWELAECCSKNTKFELQRSHEGSSFVTYKTIPGNEVNRFYQVMDNRLNAGLTYYRLRIVEEDGKISFSRIVTVINGSPHLSLAAVGPTLVTDITTVMITATGNRDVVLYITDMQGRVLLKKESQLSTGNTTIQLSAGNLVTGTYLIYAESKGQRTNSIRFIKQ